MPTASRRRPRHNSAPGHQVQPQCRRVHDPDLRAGHRRPPPTAGSTPAPGHRGRSRRGGHARTSPSACRRPRIPPRALSRPGPGPAPLRLTPTNARGCPRPELDHPRCGRRAGQTGKGDRHTGRVCRTAPGRASSPEQRRRRAAARGPGSDYGYRGERTRAAPSRWRIPPRYRLRAPVRQRVSLPSAWDDSRGRSRLAWWCNGIRVFSPSRPGWPPRFGARRPR